MRSTACSPAMRCRLSTCPATSVVGILRDRLVPGTVAAEAFGSLERLYRLVASEVGTVAWGEVALTVPDEHRPSVPPLRLAFELRPAVEVAAAENRRLPCALALAAGIERTTEAIDVRIALTLSLEVVFGTAKTVPMSRRAFRPGHTRTAGEVSPRASAAYPFHGPPQVRPPNCR